MKQKRPSMRAAINAFCRECIVDPHPGNGTWRQQVQDCTATHCPLYPLRPVTGERRREGSKTAAIPGDLDRPLPTLQGQGCAGEDGDESGQS